MKRDSHSPFFRLAVVYLSFTAVYTLVHFIPVAILQMYRFHIGWLSDPLREHFLIASVYGYTLGVIVTLSLGLKISLRSRVLIIIMLAVYNWLLGRFGILVPLAGLYTIYYTFIVVISAIILVYIFRLAKMDGYMKNI